MASFGLGTFPAMLMMGGVGRALAPAWRQRGVWLAGSCILLLGIITLGRGILPLAAHIATWLAGRPSGMTAQGDMICSHCLLPIGLRAMQRTVNGEDCAFCCYGCCIAFQVKRGKSEEWEAAWLLIRLGVGGFLSMNIMLFSLLLYTDTFTGADARLIPWVHILLWIFATPAVIILGGPFLRETWLNGLQGRLTSSSLIVIGVGAAYVYSAFAVIERSAARLFRYRHHGADAVHAWPVTGGGRPGPGGARSRTAVGRRTRKCRRGATMGRRFAARCARSKPACWCGCGRASAFRSTASSSRENPTPTRR